MDEIGRGTSHLRRPGAGRRASPRHLHDRNRAFTLFATHYFELTEFPATHDARAQRARARGRERATTSCSCTRSQPGPASRSYGVQVARLAGMPPALVRQARATLEALEAEQRAGQPQVDLFARRPRADAPAAPWRSRRSKRRWPRIDPDMLTPARGARRAVPPEDAADADQDTP